MRGEWRQNRCYNILANTSLWMKYHPMVLLSEVLSLGYGLIPWERTEIYIESCSVKHKEVRRFNITSARALSDICCELLVGLCPGTGWGYRRISARCAFHLSKVRALYFNRIWYMVYMITFWYMKITELFFSGFIWREVKRDSLISHASGAQIGTRVIAVQCFCDLYRKSMQNDGIIIIIISFLQVSSVPVVEIYYSIKEASRKCFPKKERRMSLLMSSMIRRHQRSPQSALQMDVHLLVFVRITESQIQS